MIFLALFPKAPHHLFLSALISLAKDHRQIANVEQQQPLPLIPGAVQFLTTSILVRGLARQIQLVQEPHLLQSALIFLAKDHRQIANVGQLKPLLLILGVALLPIACTLAKQIVRQIQLVQILVVVFVLIAPALYLPARSRKSNDHLNYASFLIE